MFLVYWVLVGYLFGLLVIMMMGCMFLVVSWCEIMVGLSGLLNFWLLVMVIVLLYRILYVILIFVVIEVCIVSRLE